MVHPAVQRNGMALMHADETLRNDKATVLLAVQQNGNALGCAGAEMRADREVVLAAVRQGGAIINDDLPGIMATGGPIHYAAPELKKDLGLLDAAIEATRRRLPEGAAEGEGGEGLDAWVAGATRGNGGVSVATAQARLVGAWIKVRPRAIPRWRYVGADRSCSPRRLSRHRCRCRGCRVAPSAERTSRWRSSICATAVDIGMQGRTP